MKAIPTLLVFALVACGQSEDCDPVAPFQIYFSIQSENGENIFVLPTYEINMLSVQSDDDYFKWDQSYTMEFEDQLLIGFDPVIFFNQNSYNLYFNYGNGEVDTLKTLNGNLFSQISCNVFEATGRVDFLFNGEQQSSLDLSDDNIVSRLVRSRKERGGDFKPFIIALRR